MAMDLSDLSGLVERALDGLGWGSERRLFHLDGGGATSGLLVESWLGHETVSAPYVLRFLCLSTDAHLDPEAMLVQPINLRIATADGGSICRSALVLEAEPLASNGGVARYRLTAGPWLSLLGYSTHSRVWQDKTPVQVLEDVFGTYAAHAAWRFSDEIEADLGTSSHAGMRGLRVQYRESDLDFVQRVLASEGWSYRFEEDAAAPAGHRLVIFADSGAQPEDATSAADGGIRYHRASSQEASDAIQAWGGLRQFGVAQTTWLAWDAYAQRAVTASLPAAPGGQADHAPRIERYEVLGAGASLSAELFGATDAALQRRARLQVQAQDARRKTWLARSTVRSLRPGTRFALTQSTLDALALLDRTAGQVSEREHFFVTQAHQLGINNLPRELAEHIAQRLGGRLHHDLVELFEPHPHSTVPGLAEALDFGAQRGAVIEQARRGGYGNAFSALRSSVPWRPEAPRPRGAPGLQTAIVVDADARSEPVGQAVHTDLLGRVRVRLHWQVGDEADARDDNRLSCWMRVAQRWAGPGAGSQFVPRLGMEVLVTFVDGDIEQPLITGCVYNGRGEAGQPATPGGRDAGAPADAVELAWSTDYRASAQGNLTAGNSPVWHGAGAGFDAHNNAAALSGLRSQAFDGNGHNQLLFDDTPSQLAAQAGSTQHASWLNLGHLIHRADNHRGSLRGQGFELRTDASGVLRGAQGVLLTSYALNPHQAAGHNDAQVALAQQARVLTDTLQRAAQTHQTVTLAGAVGSTGVNQTTLDDHLPPLQALHISLGGQVAAQGFDVAQGDAVSKLTQAGAGQLPHATDPLIAVSAQASLVQTAGQDLAISAGDVIHLGSGQDTQLASGGALRVHAGQALGVLGGAIEAGRDSAGTGLTLIAAQGDVRLQAQSGHAQLAAQQDLTLQSAQGDVTLSAAQTLTLSTAGGARITLAHGQLTVQCPGTLTVKAGRKALLGGASVEQTAPDEPASDFCLPCFLRAMKAASPLVPA
jgi:uncharacterized protein involved in type VI secretion and phage assembly